MDSSLIWTFSGLSVPFGLIVGFGTLSAVRGIFAFLLFMGLALSAFLETRGINEIFSYFLGQLMVMGSTYVLLRVLHPESLTKVIKEFQPGPGSCCK